MTERVEVLISPEEIQSRIAELGKQITEDYQSKELVVLSILNGAFIFAADLTRAIDLPLQCEFMRISSYGEGKVSSGKVDVLLDVNEKKIRGKHVLLVEDIVDTGNSIAFLQKHLQKFSPASIKVCSFLLKEEQLRHALTIDYLGFSIPSLFVIGYGLDYAGIHRNLPFVGVLLKKGQTLTEEQRTYSKGRYNGTRQQDHRTA